MHVVDAFVEYAKAVIDALAPKVRWWITFNEQNLYGLPMTYRIAGAPEPDDPRDEGRIFQIEHNIMVAHARVANYLHENYPAAKIGAMCAFTSIYPASPDPRDVLAATVANRFANWLVLDTASKGSYPRYFASYVAHRGIELDMSASELSAIASMRNDFSAFSYYRSQCVSALGITEDTPADAVELDGAEVIGYLGWGLIDIPSSSGDIEKRYGAVYVDYDAASGERLKRIPKKSFTWFKRAYESNGEDLG